MPHRFVTHSRSSSDSVISDIDDEFHFDDIHGSVQPLFGAVSVTSSPRSSRLKTSCRHHLLRLARSTIWNNVTVSDLLSLLVSALPYITFLLVYVSNCRLLVLPTSEGGGYHGCSANPGQVTSSAEMCSGVTRLFDIGTFERSWLKFSPNRLVASLQSSVFDFLSTGPYLAHYVMPVVYPLSVIIAGRIDCAQQFFRLLGWAMWVHYIVWWLLPTGPPWYYDSQTAVNNMCRSVETLRLAAVSNSSEHVVDAMVRRVNEGPAFARVDAMTGNQFFRTMFAANPVPYAAFPSGHVAWPTCMLLTQPWRRWPFVIYVAVVAWATMYSGHHYISDVVGAVILVLSVSRTLAWVSASSSSSSFSLDIICEPCLPVFNRLRRLSHLRFDFCRTSENSKCTTHSPRRRSPLSA